MNMSNLIAQKEKHLMARFSIKYERDLILKPWQKAPTEVNYLIFENNTKVTQDLGGAFRHVITVGDQVNNLFDIPGQKWPL